MASEEKVLEEQLSEQGYALIRNCMIAGAVLGLCMALGLILLFTATSTGGGISLLIVAFLIFVYFGEAARMHRRNWHRAKAG